MMHRGRDLSGAARTLQGRLSLLVLLLGGMVWPASADQIRGIIVSEVTIPSDAAYENTVALTVEEVRGSVASTLVRAGQASWP